MDTKIQANQIDKELLFINKVTNLWLFIAAVLELW